MEDLVWPEGAQVEVIGCLEEEVEDDAGWAGSGDGQAGGPETELVEAGLELGAEDEAGAAGAVGAGDEAGALLADLVALEPGLEEAAGAEEDGLAEAAAIVGAELGPAG
jgi:hypothetical protein